MTKSGNGRLLVIAVVILSYAIFALPSIAVNGFTKTPQAFYQSLTEGFLSGQLNMTIKPSAGLLKLTNPYDPAQNAHVPRSDDASFYHGKYYLYFGPLPVLTFFLPFKLLTGLYAPQSLAIVFFSSLAFIFNFLVLIKIRQKFFPTISELQLNFLGLLLGFANNLLYVFLRPNFYEIAIISAYCFMSMAVYFLYEVFSNDGKLRTVLAFAICLSLTVAGRPHFALAVLFLIPITAFFITKYAPKEKRSWLLFSLLMPVLLIGSTLALYNYLRFDSIFEFGRSYQLGIHDFRYDPIIRPNFYCTMVLQLYYYFIQPIFLYSLHPIPAVMWGLVQDTTYEDTIGIFTTTPIVFMVLLLPKLLLLNSKNNNYMPKQLLWFSTATTITALIVLFFLASLRSIAQRYEIDFLPYLIICAILNLWLLQQYTVYPRLLAKIAQAFLFATCVISILIGINFGMLAYRLSVNVILLSAMTNVLFLLIPGFLLLTYCMIRSTHSETAAMTSVRVTDGLKIGWPDAQKNPA